MQSRASGLGHRSWVIVEMNELGSPTIGVPVPSGVVSTHSAAWSQFRESCLTVTVSPGNGFSGASETFGVGSARPANLNSGLPV